MRILVVNAWDLFKLPPVISLVNILNENGHDVCLITEGDPDQIREVIPPDVKLSIINIKSSGGPISATKNFFQRKKDLKNIVSQLMINNDLLWTTTDLTAREIGSDLLKYNHVMQLMELIEDIPLFPYQSKIKANLKKYAKNAKAVVVPEYNRAHILQTWWGLEKTPFVLPNKQNYSNLSDDLFDLPNNVKEMINRFNDKKIILYQGVFKKERPLEPFARLSVLLDDTYVICFMGGKNKFIDEIKGKYPKIEVVPFLNPPTHLMITKIAHIGLLPYLPSIEKGQHYSILNSLYSAPNKIFEYAYFGIPMLGTRVPGVEVPLQMAHMGVSTNLTDRELVESIKLIEKEYVEYSDNAREYYASINLHKIVEEIINNE